MSSKNYYQKNMVKFIKNFEISLHSQSKIPFKLNFTVTIHLSGKLLEIKLIISEKNFSQRESLFKLE